MRAGFAGMLALWLASGTALAAPCAGFTDVDSTSSFCVNVAWLKSHNITLGCTATTYCPNVTVSRLQMAAFMNRLGNITFIQGGNAFGAPAQLGTTDNQRLEIIANGKRAFRVEPTASNVPNIFAGYENNAAYPGVIGATVAGGGSNTDHTALTNDFCGYAFLCANTVTDHYGTVGGGAGNIAGDTDGNFANGAFATVAGGLTNAATNRSAIGGGNYNTATGFASVISGGGDNNASGGTSTVSGGISNAATGDRSAVAGGFSNKATGIASFVAGGQFNTASGLNSFAAGDEAGANADGCVVFANGAADFVPVNCGGANRFVVSAWGGYFLTSGSSNAGVALAPGTSAWAVLSDRNAKSDITPVDTNVVLERLAAMPVSTWRWNSEPGAIMHMGPMAQDFYAAFGLGDSDKRIVTVDADGVALAAIQALYSRERDKEAALHAELAAKEAELAGLELRLEKVEALLVH